MNSRMWSNLKGVAGLEKKLLFTITLLLFLSLVSCGSTATTFTVEGKVTSIGFGNNNFMILTLNDGTILPVSILSARKVKVGHIYSITYKEHYPVGIGDGWYYIIIDAQERK